MKYLKYALFFAMTIVLQVFFLDRMWLGIYISVYLSLLLILDVKTPKWIVLLVGFGSGAIVDVMSAGAGLNAAVTGFAAFCRMPVLRFTIPSNNMEEGGPVVSSMMPAKNFIIYTVCMTAIWSVMYFPLEAGFQDPFEILIRIVVNIVFGTALLFVIQLPFRN